MHGVIIFLVVLGCAKVDNFNCTFIFYINKNIFWLQISVSNVLSMAVGDGLEDHFADLGCFLFVEDLTLRYFFVKLMSVAQFCHQQQLTPALIYLIQAHNIWMVEVLKNVDFILQADSFFRIERQLVQDLDGAQLSIAPQSSLLHRSEGTLAQDIAKLVLFLKYGHVFILDNEVPVTSNHITFICVDYFLVKRHEILKKTE